MDNSLNEQNYLSLFQLKVKFAQSNSLLIHDSPWKSPDKNTGVGCHALLQGIFPSRGLNQSLPHSEWIFYQLSHQGSTLFQLSYPSFV